MHLTLKLVFGTIGNATALALFLSPGPTFCRIVRRRSTEEFSGLPYVCTLFNCMLWVLYGLPFISPHALLILTINGFGVALELVYIMIFLCFATRRKQMQMMKWMLVVVLAYVVIVLVVVFGLHTSKLRKLVVGSICVVVTVSMYASPLSIMGTVTRTRSVEYMPFIFSLSNFLNALVWVIYSIGAKDIFVAIPNGLGCVTGIAQLVLYALYMNATPVNKDDVKQGKPTTISLTNIEKQENNTRTNILEEKQVKHPHTTTTNFGEQEKLRPMTTHPSDDKQGKPTHVAILVPNEDTNQTKLPLYN